MITILEAEADTFMVMLHNAKPMTVVWVEPFKDSSGLIAGYHVNSLTVERVWVRWGYFRDRNRAFQAAVKRVAALGGWA